MAEATQSAKQTQMQIPTLTPYIQRLLRLIKEGTKEHGLVSAQLLGKVTSSTALSSNDCILLWDILGRLQSYLYNCSNWINRESASVAMYYVAQNIPQRDQTDFLNQSPCEEDSENAMGTATWLELSDIIKNLDDILKHGQLFLSGEVIDEDDEKCNEDVNKLENLNIFEENNYLVKMELQRKIISKRLGLTFLHNKDDILDSFLSKEDSASTTTTATPARSKRKRKRGKVERIVYKVEDEGDDDEKKDENNRLLYILQLQNNPKGKEEEQAKHVNAQRLLAMDLMYHTTHSQWKIRHGAFLGLLSLLRAWKQKQAPSNKKIGKWQMDILSRSTCILCLDQFVDFSILEDVKAPVRETCAQYISYCCSVYKDIQKDILVLLLKLLLCHEDKWHIQFGALLVVKYLCARDASLLLEPVKLLEEGGVTTLLSTLQQMWNEQFERQQRQNVIPEILNLITQVLLIPFDTSYPPNYSKLQEESLKNEILKVSCVWLHTNIQQLVTFSSQDEDMAFTSCKNSHIVQLFTELIKWNSQDVFSILQKQLKQHNWMESIFRCYLHFLSCPTSSKEIQISSLVCFQFFIPFIGNQILHQHEEEEEDETWFQTSMVVMYSDGLTTLFNIFLRELEKDVLRVLFDTWKSVQFSISFSTSPKILLFWKRMYLSCLLKFFNIPHHYPTATKLGKDDLDSSYQESSVDCRVQACHALFQLCQTIDVIIPQNHLLDYLPFCIITMFMQSPCYYHVETSLLLYYQYIITNTRTKNDEYLINFCKSILYDNKPLFYKDDDGADMELMLCYKSYPTILQQILFSSTNYDQLNQDIITKKLIDVWNKGKLLQAQQTTATTVRSMRIRALLAGILIHLSSKTTANTNILLSMKLTPIIRATITSIKNECDSRQSLTINDIIQLLLILQHHPAVRDKIIYNVVNMSLLQHYEIQNVNMTAYQSSRCVLKTIFQNDHPKFGLLQGLPPIWSLLESLSRISDAYCNTSINEDHHYRSLQLLEIISESRLSSIRIFQQIFQETKIIVGAINMACHIHSSKRMKSIATLTLTNFCNTQDSTHQFIAFQTILTCLFEKFQNRDIDKLRCNACYVLHSIVASLNVTSLSRVVKCLLPVSMYLMNDPTQECARCSCSIFATLVRIAPLAVMNDSNDQCLPQFVPFGTVKNTSSQVMDHLLRGLPLPACTLPVVIHQHLQQNHITLRPYQKEGIAWINFLQTVHLHGILCDDMGLGKTLQALIGIAIAHCNHHSKDYKSLIICPTTLIGHWCQEIQRFFPNTSTNTFFHVVEYTNVGSSKERKALLQQNPNCNIVITSYSMIRKDIDVFKREKWLYCCLDEGHLLKNPKTATAKAVKQIQSKYKLILTGTILQNHVQELWAIFDYLMPNFLGNSKQFHTTYAKPIDKGHQSHATPEEVNKSIQRLKSLHQQVLPFILRREKHQVLPELPPKIITDVPCVLSKEQEQLYSAFCCNLVRSSSTSPSSSLTEISTALEEVWNNDSDCWIPNSSGKHNVLTSFLYLRLLCTHPILVAKKLNDVDTEEEADARYSNLNCSGKLLALNDLLRNSGIYDEEDCVAADNDVTALYINDNDNMNSDVEGEELDGYIFNDKTNGPFFENVSTTNDGLPSTITESKKCILFAQFTKTLDVIEKYLFQPHMPSLSYLRLDGTTIKTQQQHIINQFQTNNSIQLLLLTTKVGGLGLNLNMADMVIVFEQDWNPQVDLQAMDRAHRIGQKKTVNVYRFITKNTIEEKIRRLQTQKVAVTSAIVNTENSCLFSMGTDRLLDIFSFSNDDNCGSSSKASSLPLSSNGPAMEHDNNDDMYKEEYSNLSLDAYLEWFR